MGRQRGSGYARKKLLDEHQRVGRQVFANRTNEKVGRGGDELVRAVNPSALYTSGLCKELVSGRTIASKAVKISLPKRRHIGFSGWTNTLSAAMATVCRPAPL